MVDIEKQAAFWFAGGQEDWQVAIELVESGRIRQGLFFAQFDRSAAGHEKNRRGSGMVDQRIREIVKSYLDILRKNGFQVTQGVIFGSQATGKAGEWSDIDLLVISPRFDKVRKREDINQLWRLAARADSRIEPIPCGEMQWSQDDTSAIVEIARREGEVVTIR